MTPTSKTSLERSARNGWSVFWSTGSATSIIRLIQKWLKAGIFEDGIVTVDDKGTGQGSVTSPLVGNIYLHYVLDLWAKRWRQREPRAT
ncbi:hypothetical protein [Pararhizobium sp. A13]|uniref:hypothetical protein n=1 Tax=Pararhizobium sp. A13 TaxID=3133975 RepID=UPI0032525E0A